MDQVQVQSQLLIAYDTLFLLNRRPVAVNVSRVQFPDNPSNINNNKARKLVHPPNPINKTPTTPTEGPTDRSRAVGVASQMDENNLPFDLPAVSLCFALLQVFLYFMRDSLGITGEEAVYVSWKTVVTEGEVWRLLCAQFFYFGRVHIFFNVVTLMGIGRFLEKKIQRVAFALLVILMSAISNLLYIFINDILCSGPSNEYTVGFSTAMFSLRMIHIFTMDSEANNGKGDPNLIFGFFPVHLPPYLSPWQPVIETIFFDIFVIGRCVAATVSGMIAGLLFPYLMKEYRHYVMIPQNKPPPPSPPEVKSRPNKSEFWKDYSNNNASFSGSDVNENYYLNY